MFDTPDQETSKLEIPDFEDARADFAPYYSTSTSLKAAQRQVLELMTGEEIIEGDFEE